MVAMADRSHSTQPPTPVAYHRTMTQTMSKVTKSQRWGSPLATRPQVGCSFSSQMGLRDQQFKPPSTQPFLASRVLPSSKVMSSQIIQSFWNRLHFARPAFGGLYMQQKATIPLETRWLPCNASGINMLIFPEGNPSNESVTELNWNDCTTGQPHQSQDNTVCDNKECDSTRAVNLITSDDLTQCHDQEIDPVAPEGTAELCVEDDSDLSDYEPSHSEYESDDDDCVEFSYEFLPVPESAQLLTPNSTKYVTLVSSESGYFECAPGCEQLDEAEGLEDCWSDTDSDGEIEFCSEVWDSFEIQALSPMVKCTQTKTCTKAEKSQSATGKVATNTRQTPLSKALQLPNKEEAEDQRETDYITMHNPKKQVSFKPDSELVEVHTIVAWEYAYRAARKGPWEQFARDRCHFRRRIDSVSTVLEPCLSAKLSRMSSLRES